MKASKFGWPRSGAIALGLALLYAASACSSTGGDTAKNDPGGSATETNVAGIHCYKDDDCGAGRTCMHFPGQDDGTCKGAGDDDDGGVVTKPDNHGGVAPGSDAGMSTAPGPHIGGLAAKCDVDTDCGGVKCLHPNGPDQPGVCDVQQMGAR